MDPVGHPLRTDAVVIGAGVVGLAIARALALAGREVIVLERERGIGLGTSSRNSEVLHAGLYYAPDSLKARLCVTGRQALVTYCDARAVPYRLCGKLIVATTEAESDYLQWLAARAAENGVSDVELLDATQIKALEPALLATRALHSRASGIVDARSLMLSYQADAEDAGAQFAFRTPVRGAEARSDCIALAVGGEEPATIEAEYVVNAAGLDAWEISALVDGLDRTTIPPKYLAKGSYFTLLGKAPFDRLIYPVPEPGGLGIHLTLDMGGQARFGPDVEWVDAVDYAVDPARASRFYGAIRRYWPGLKDGTLTPGYAGIRARTAPPGQESDFVIQGPAETGLARYAALYGIESPGLTASLAIGASVAGLLLT